MGFNLLNSHPFGAFLNATGGPIGGFLNNVTGATGAAAQQQKYNLINGAVNQAYALQSAAINNQYQKEFAQNAHQWEVEDLKKAGLNPVLSAGGQGASASGGGVGSGTTSGAGIAQSGINPFEAILNGVSTMTTARRTNQEAKNLSAQEKLTTMQTLAVAEQVATSPVQRKEIQEKISLLSKQASQIETENALKEQELNWIKEHPFAYSVGKYGEIFGDTVNKVMDVASKIYIGSKFKGAMGSLTQAGKMKAARKAAEALFKKKK